MKLLSLENILVQTPAVQLARLSGPHGYRFDGDTVHLNAMFALLDDAAHDRWWALQLWACYSAPTSAQELAGHIVAEVPLPPMGELADESEHFEVSALAWPPPGPGQHAMVLVLAAGRPGQYNDVHDFAVYPQPQAFVQPRINGTVGYSIDGARLRLSVESVENPRPADNISGTLSLELWALSSPFTGGRFQGGKLAGVEIGSIQGQSQRGLRPFDLALTQPPAGDWQIVLMLREWTVGGFVTRDFTNFANRFISAPVGEVAPAPSAEAPVAEKPAAIAVEKPVAAAVVAPAASVIGKPVVAAVEIPAVAVVEKPVAAVVEQPVVAAVEKPVAAKVEKPVAPVVEKPVAPDVAKAPAPAPKAAASSPAKAAVDVSDKRVSVNHARVEELTAMEGITKTVAESIVKNRPYSSLDNLREVKGLDARILAKIRSSLKL